MTNRVDINNVLAEMRNIRSQMQSPTRLQNEPAPQELRPTRETQETGETPGFGQMLKQAVDHVNQTQKTASGLATAFEKGDPQVDLTSVMIASQKSSVAVQAMTQVRNKVIQAYEDIMKMPI